jgi:hypothetical protein
VSANWYIHHFSDYHEIGNIGKYKAVELGCFPTKNEFYHRYFGLFYIGRKPALDDILKAIDKMIDYDKTKDSEFTPKEIKKSIKLALKGQSC